MTTDKAMPMNEEMRWGRLRELHDAMTAKRRYDPPPEVEADQWIFGFEDRDDEHGRTVERGIPVWTPRAESDEWHRLRFGPGDGDNQREPQR